MTASTKQGRWSELKAFINGPTSGYPDSNRETFSDVEAALYRWSSALATDPEGFSVINPATLIDGTADIGTYMQKGLRELLTADTLVLLPGWKDSEAAKLNVRVGLATCMRFYEAKANRFAGSDPLTDPPHVEWTFQEITGPLEHEPEGNDSPRAALLTGAAHLISGNGDAIRPLRRTADVLSALGYRFTSLGAHEAPCAACGARQLQGYDSAVFVAAVRFTRITTEPGDEANWKDLAGQVAYGYEAATMKAAS